MLIKKIDCDWTSSFLDLANTLGLRVNDQPLEQQERFTDILSG